MTTIEYVEKLRKDFESYATNVCQLPLPELSYSMLGQQVVACEGLIFSSTGSEGTPTNQEGGRPCDYIQVATIVVTLARDCAYEMNDDGTDDPAKIAEVTAQLDQDSQCLWNWALTINAFWSMDFSVSFDLVGGLGVTTLSLTTGVP